MAFDQNDINRIVFHLKLPPTERRFNSSLAYRLRFIEEEDLRNTTDIEARIKFLLDELDRLDGVINTETGTEGGSAVSALAGDQRSVSDMYGQSQQFANRGASEGTVPAQVAGYWYLYKKYYRELRRELWYVRYDRQIPTDGVVYDTASWSHYGLVRGDVVG